jgi:hypothetical protein
VTSSLFCLHVHTLTVAPQHLRRAIIMHSLEQPWASQGYPSRPVATPTVAFRICRRRHMVPSVVLGRDHFAWRDLDQMTIPELEARSQTNEERVRLTRQAGSPVSAAPYSARSARRR